MNNRKHANMGNANIYTATRSFSHLLTPFSETLMSSVCLAAGSQLQVTQWKHDGKPVSIMVKRATVGLQLVSRGTATRQAATAVWVSGGTFWDFSVLDV